jgi:hypothetical protein
MRGPALGVWQRPHPKRLLMVLVLLLLLQQL